MGQDSGEASIDPVFQLHLTPPDAAEGKLDFDKVGSTREDAARFFKSFVDGQINLSR